MNNFFKYLDLVPGLIFFISYKMTKDMILATALILISLVITGGLQYFYTKKISKIQIITLASAIVLGLPTILLKDPNIIKIKPTVVSFLIAFLIALFQFVLHKNPFYYLMGKEIPLPQSAYALMSKMWLGYFIFAGILNIIIAFYLTDIFGITNLEAENIWVDYKTIFNPIIIVVFTIVSFFYIAKKYPGVLEGLSKLKEK